MSVKLIFCHWIKIRPLKTDFYPCYSNSPEKTTTRKYTNLNFFFQFTLQNRLLSVYYASTTRGSTVYQLNKRSIENTQVSFLLLNKCVAYCRFAFFSRTSINPAAFEVFQQFDCCIRKVLESLVGSSTTDSQWTQATLSIRLGLGLRSVYEHRYAAYAASLDLCRTNISRLVKGDKLLEDLGLAEVITHYNTQVEPADHISRRRLGDSLIYRTRYRGRYLNS